MTRKHIKDCKALFVKVTAGDHEKLVNEAHDSRMNLSQYVRTKLGLPKDYDNE